MRDRKAYRAVGMGRAAHASLRSETRENYVSPPRCAWAPPFLLPSRTHGQLGPFRQGIILCIVCVLFLCVGCVRERQGVSGVRAVTGTVEAQLRGVAEVAEFGGDRARRVEAAREGRGLADQCVASGPSNPACYYYRAVLTGLYYELTIIGYQKGLKQMVADCERLIVLDPRYAEAGAYRILGQIYTQIPETAFRPDSLVRDLSRARTYLEQAVRLAPHSVENQLALCHTTLDLDDAATAQRACSAAQQHLSAARDDPGYAAWRNELSQLKKRLAQ